jgi:serine/threonine protein kinase
MDDKTLNGGTASGELFQAFFDRLSEAKVYLEQGLREQTGEILAGLSEEIDKSGLSDEEKEELHRSITSCREESVENPDACRSGESAGKAASGPADHFEYGLALMDGQFWEEAIAEFKKAADLGWDNLKASELCGDCASKMGKWDEAIHFYNLIYSNKTIVEELRKNILLKINKCSQINKKVEIDSTIQARNGSGREPKKGKEREIITSSISSLDRYSVNLMLGQTVTSWREDGPKEQDCPQLSYRIMNLLHVGSSSIVVELEESGSGKKLAGQNLAGQFGGILSPRGLNAWAREQMATQSNHLVRLYDLANSDDHFFIVREHYPLSLSDILATGELIPLPLAIKFAYQLLEALGDLHLHLGNDGKIRNTFHLDLRPSRIMVRTDRPCIKLCNGGLWKQIEKTAPAETEIKKLPLHYLSYRAPEQFRTYLSRKKPPAFTDIYLFGALFYEMLTGTPPFKASSYGEYEIQHCEQYPSPPRVWRPEIPDTLNDMIMRCLEFDPMKRWRSTTQMSLVLEKAFPDALLRERDDSYQKFLGELKLIP